MLRFSYSMNGLTNLDFFSAIDEVEKANYDGIELFFEENEFDPYKLTSADLQKIKSYFQNKKIMPVAISTATPCLLSDIPHEPSLISLNLSERQRRIDLIKRGIEIAKEIGIPIVSFQSGYLREEHVKNPTTDPRKLLINGIKECLENVGDITLVIEPEPGMYIETLGETIDLINQVNSKNFKLHLDICHAYCSEEDYVKSIAEALPYIAYMHLADIKEGYNLKLICLDKNDEIPDLDLSSKGYLIYQPSNDLFIFLDKDNSVCFHFEPKENIKSILDSLIPGLRYETVYLNSFSSLNVPLNVELENKAFLDSVGGVSFDILRKAKYVLRHLRSKQNDNGQIFIEKPVCNTIKGKVHYHEVPGDGEIDFKQVLNVLINKNYNGYVTVELYNHSDIWEKILPGTKDYLLDCI